MPSSASAPTLADTALALVNIPSESRSEEVMHRYVATQVPVGQVFDDGESLVYAKRAGKPLVLFAGHLDTVPAQGNHLAHDVAFLFFPREELGPAENPLPGLFEQVPLVDEAALVVCLEPTDNTLQLGCLGNLNARVVFEGRSAHSARPWLGVNAVGIAFEGLQGVLGLAPRDVTIDGLLFREVLSVTQIQGGIATNVIPARVEATLNFRYAPDRTPVEAEARVRELVGRSVEILSNSPPAHVALASPVVEALRRAGDLDLQPKQAWTNVADFAARGLDAVNFGPGATRYAHTVDERVEIAALERCLDVLQPVLLGTV
jgi:succinyl-diaminopimelate desuccinylase